MRDDGMTGLYAEKSRRWKGDKACYAAKHLWLTKHYSHEKTECVHCGKNKDEVSRLEWANVSGEYKRERSDYICLCPSCHRKMDFKKTHCVNGHELNEVNLKLNSRGHRTCRICTIATNKRHKEKKNTNHKQNIDPI